MAESFTGNSASASVFPGCPEMAMQWTPTEPSGSKRRIAFRRFVISCCGFETVRGNGDLSFGIRRSVTDAKPVGTSM